MKKKRATNRYDTTKHFEDNLITISFITNLRKPSVLISGIENLHGLQLYCVVISWKCSGSWEDVLFVASFVSCCSYILISLNVVECFVVIISLNVVECFVFFFLLYAAKDFLILLLALFRLVYCPRPVDHPQTHRLARDVPTCFAAPLCHLRIL